MSDQKQIVDRRLGAIKGSEVETRARSEKRQGLAGEWRIPKLTRWKESCEFGVRQTECV